MFGDLVVLLLQVIHRDLKLENVLLKCKYAGLETLSTLRSLTAPCSCGHGQWLGGFICTAAFKILHRAFNVLHSSTSQQACAHAILLHNSYTLFSGKSIVLWLFVSGVLAVTVL